TPQRAANSDSRRSVASPMVIQPLRKGSCTAANSSDPKSGSNNGTRQFTIRPSGSFVWQEALAVLPEFLGSILVIFRAPDIQPHAIEGVGSNGLPTSQHVEHQVVESEICLGRNPLEDGGVVNIDAHAG